MNIEELLQDDVQLWISEHIPNKIVDLALRKSPFPSIEMKELVQQVQGRKIAVKKFNLLNHNYILFPPKLNLEQTSSQITAEYKSSIVQGDKIMDITGGFGIDSLSFSNKFEHVIHVEKNESLQRIASHNFQVLNKNNIKSIYTDGLNYLSNSNKDLDVIYVDPSRRSASKEKVFLLEDLEPNILKYLDLFFEKADTILIKLSPLIDIHYLIQVLPDVSEVHVVALKNEVKEVLVKLEKGFENNSKVIAVNLETNQDTFSYSYNDIINSSTAIGELQQYLYEPNAAIQKSGGINLLCELFNLNKLHSNTQLLTSDKVIPHFSGRVFEIIDTIKNPKKELKNKSIMAIHRNFPIKLKDLQKKYKFHLDGTNPVLFSQDSSNHLIKWMRQVE